MLFRHLFIAFAVIFLVGAAAAAAPLRIGILTDVHAHDTDSPAERKVMTNYVERLSAFASAMSAWPADAVVELGDLVNGAYVMGVPIADLAGAPARVAGILSEAANALLAWGGPTHFVLGNHDVYTLSKAEFLAGVGAPSTTWSFDLGGFHFIGLDAEFKKTGEDFNQIFWVVQGTIPPAELEWLKSDLALTSLPTIVFVHQPLDELQDLGGPSISNWSEAQATLASSGRVIAVFQGHMHESKHNVIDGIHYVRFAALVEEDGPTPPSWAAVTLDAEARTVRIDGAGLQEDLEFTY
jgi:alkaline phosphatase